MERRKSILTHILATTAFDIERVVTFFLVWVAVLEKKSVRTEFCFR